MKLDKKSIIYRSASNIWKIAAIIVFSGGTQVQSFNLTAAAVLAVIIGLTITLSLFWEYLVWRNYEFFIEGDSIKINRGVIQKTQREIPLHRVQNVDVKKNFFHRILGIAQIKLETAGGSTTEASLRYVSESQASEIRQRIRRLKKDVEIEEEKTEREPLYEIEDRELALLGATSVNPRVVLGIFALLGIGGGVVGSALNQSSLAAVTILGSLAVGVAVVTWVSGFVSALLRYFDFRLHRREDSLEYERGLLNRSEGSIPLKKIQKYTLEENPLKRLIGYSTLKIETAGYSAEQTVQQGSEAAIPLATRERTLELAKKIENFDNLELNQIPKRARRRYFGRYMILNLLISSGVFIFGEINSVSLLLPAGVFLSLTLISRIAAHLKWKNRGYMLGERHFVSMNGFWNRSTMITPYYRIQNLIEEQTIFQRRWNLGTLVLDIAGTNGFGGDPRASDIDIEDLEELKSKSYKKFQDSLN